MEKPKQRIVLLAGLPYSGKTNLALLLREHGWDHIQSHAEANVVSLQNAIRSSVKGGRDVVVDGGNLTKTERQQWLTVASETVPPRTDGTSNISQFVVICAVHPTGTDAQKVTPEHLEFRRQYLTPEATAAVSIDNTDRTAVAERIHEVIVALDPTFEVPYTHEAIDSLAHVRDQAGVDMVLTWLSFAAQYAAADPGALKIGWSTPPSSTCAAAAQQWMQAYQLRAQAAQAATQAPVSHSMPLSPLAAIAAPAAALQMQSPNPAQAAAVAAPGNTYGSYASTGTAPGLAEGVTQQPGGAQAQAGGQQQYSAAGAYGPAGAYAQQPGVPGVAAGGYTQPVEQAPAQAAVQQQQQQQQGLYTPQHALSAQQGAGAQAQGMGAQQGMATPLQYAPVGAAVPPQQAALGPQHGAYAQQAGGAPVAQQAVYVQQGAYGQQPPPAQGVQQPPLTGGQQQQQQQSQGVYGQQAPAPQAGPQQGYYSSQAAGMAPGTQQHQPSPQMQAGGYSNPPPASPQAPVSGQYGTAPGAGYMAPQQQQQQQHTQPPATASVGHGMDAAQWGGQPPVGALGNGSSYAAAGYGAPASTVPAGGGSYAAGGYGAAPAGKRGYDDGPGAGYAPAGALGGQALQGGGHGANGYSAPPDARDPKRMYNPAGPAAGAQQGAQQSAQGLQGGVRGQPLQQGGQYGAGGGPGAGGLAPPAAQAAVVGRGAGLGAPAAGMGAPGAGGSEQHVGQYMGQGGGGGGGGGGGPPPNAGGPGSGYNPGSTGGPPHQGGPGGPNTGMGGPGMGPPGMGGPGGGPGLGGPGGGPIMGMGGPGGPSMGGPGVGPGGPGMGGHGVGPNMGMGGNQNMGAPGNMGASEGPRPGAFHSAPAFNRDGGFNRGPSGPSFNANGGFHKGPAFNANGGFNRGGPNSSGGPMNSNYKQGAPPLQPVQPVQPVTYDATDTRPIILFELSGVLTNPTRDRVLTRSRNHLARPGVSHLARLLPHCRLGVYSTANDKTVSAALAVIVSTMRSELALEPDGWRLLRGAQLPARLQGENPTDEPTTSLLTYPEGGVPTGQRSALTSADIQGSLAWQSVFDPQLVLDRTATELTQKDGRDSIIKVPEKLFPHAHERVMVIDEISWHTTDPHIVLVRRWDQDNRADNTVRTLVDGIIERLPAANGDLRTMTKALNALVKEVPPRALPVYKVSDSQEGYCEHYPQRPSAEVCQFFKDTGHCRFGEGCTYHHPVESQVKLNRAGYPMRPNTQSCHPFLKTGFCAYGKACVKHHPNLEAVPGASHAAPIASDDPAARAALAIQSRFKIVNLNWQADFPQQSDTSRTCHEFMETGRCRYSKTCKYHHPIDRVTPVNNYGLPMRAGEAVCEFFVRNGDCRFGPRCTKHHPTLDPGPQPGHPGHPASQGPPHGAPMGMGMPGNGPMGPHGGPMGPYGGAMGPGGAPGMGFRVLNDVDGYHVNYVRNVGAEECPNYVRTGFCRFGPTCKFDHPPQYAVKLNMAGLPLRPGEQVCKFYLQNGQCAYGASCRMHHPNIVPEGGGPEGGPGMHPGPMGGPMHGGGPSGPMGGFAPAPDMVDHFNPGMGGPPMGGGPGPMGGGPMGPMGGGFGGPGQGQGFPGERPGMQQHQQFRPY